MFGKLNKSFTYVVPLVFDKTCTEIFGKSISTEVTPKDELVNSYLFTEDFGLRTYSVALLIRYSDDLSRQHLLDKKLYNSNLLFCKDIYYDNIMYTLFIYTVPDEFTEDINKMFEGNFHNISREAKTKIVNFRYKRMYNASYEVMYGQVLNLHKIEARMFKEQGLDITQETLRASERLDCGIIKKGLPMTVVPFVCLIVT